MRVSQGGKSSTHSLKDDTEPPLKRDREPRQLRVTQRALGLLCCGAEGGHSQVRHQPRGTKRPFQVG